MSKNGTIKYKKADGTVEKLLPKTSAANVSLTSISGMSATNAQSAFEELNNAIKNAGGGGSGVAITNINVNLAYGDSYTFTNCGTADITFSASTNLDMDSCNIQITWGTKSISFTLENGAGFYFNAKTFGSGFMIYQIINSFSKEIIYASDLYNATHTFKVTLKSSTADSVDVALRGGIIKYA